MSRPHVTVRYFERLSIPKEYLSTKVIYIDLIAPGSFGLEATDPATSRTVFIRCKSDDLVPLEHKPHYPASEFHITVYDGKSTKLAKALLKVLKSFEWQFRVPLPRDTALTRIKIKPRRSRREQTPREYKAILEQIFYNATSEHLSWQYLVNLSDQQRLKLSRAICNHLRQATANFRKIGFDYGQSTNNTERTNVGKSDEPEIHLTPPELAREIAEYAVGLIDPTGSRVHFGDPAVGTGAFYSALLQAISQKQVASAIGIDISIQQVAAAQWRWSHRGMEVIRGDYLHMERLPPRTLILANPPYLRHQGIPSKYKQELRERASVNMGMRVSARSGLYVYFLLLSHAWMKQDAVAAWLVPSEFMQTAYGAAIRHYLTHRVQLVRIHQFGHDDPQFENALVLPAVIAFRNHPPCVGQTAILSAGGTLGNPTTSERVRVEVLRREAKWFIPRRPLSKYRSSDVRIRDIFVVRRGIATGANDFFVMKREAAARLGIPKDALRPVLPKARTLETDIVEREADGYPQVYPQLCLLDYHLTEDEIRTQHPRLMEYLMTARGLGILDRYLVRQRHPWYKQEQREPAPFLCTYMGRRRADAPPIRFIWNKSDAVVTNTYLMLYPRAALARLLQDRPGVAAEMFALLQGTARETMSESWRVHAGGLYKIEPGELLDVRLSSSPPWLVQIVDSSLSLKASYG
ncbi:MAG: SAM-dependent DNA methyltransferase [Deltaproteobacteria bacterium]|nr:SAM-dependent DNA methyltransferase [Deltaproteobacteria bacterium]